MQRNGEQLLYRPKGKATCRCVASRKYSGEDRARGEEGGESKEGAATGLHCTQGAIRTPFQERRASEDLDPIIITPFALQRNANADSTISSLRNISKVRTKDHRTMGSKFPRGDGVPSFSERPRLKSFGCQLHNAGVSSPRDARYKFAPWDTQSSRKLLKSATRSITNATK